MEYTPVAISVSWWIIIPAVVVLVALVILRKKFQG